MRSPLVKLCTPYVTQREVKYTVTFFFFLFVREKITGGCCRMIMSGDRIPWDVPLSVTDYGGVTRTGH